MRFVNPFHGPGRREGQRFPQSIRMLTQPLSFPPKHGGLLARALRGVGGVT